MNLFPLSYVQRIERAGRIGASAYRSGESYLSCGYMRRDYRDAWQRGFLDAQVDERLSTVPADGAALNPFLQVLF